MFFVFKYISLFVTYSILCLNPIESLKILGLFPYEGKSHFFVYKTYLDELVKRGHELTVVSPFPRNTPLPNYTDITLKTNILVNAKSAEVESPLTTLYVLTNIGVENCKVMLANEEVQRLWKIEQKFDLVVTEAFNSDCSLALAHKLGAPVVTLSSCGMIVFHYGRFGIPGNFLQQLPSANLAHRLVMDTLIVYANTVYDRANRESDKVIAQYFEAPPVSELAKKGNLLLLYNYFPLSGGWLSVPNVVEVGGYHVAQPKPLVGELARFVEQAPDGVVLVSFGSVVKASTLAADKLQAIVGALAQLPQRVVWKWEDDTTHRPTAGDPGNILRMSWLPQNDILAHPNVLAFYSHGGMLGTTEAIHHGVPIVAMPIFGDQPANAAAIKDSGLGVHLDFENLTADALLAALRRVLDPKFRARVKELSRVWHDRPISAMDTAVYWTEFTARNRNFSIRNPWTEIPWYKHHFLDELAVLLTAVVLVVAAAALCCLRLWRFSQSARNKDTKRD